jgi:hypothetical protein
MTQALYAHINNKRKKKKKSMVTRVGVSRLLSCEGHTWQAWASEVREAGGVTHAPPELSTE